VLPLKKLAPAPVVSVHPSRSSDPDVNIPRSGLRRLLGCVLVSVALFSALAGRASAQTIDLDKEVEYSRRVKVVVGGSKLISLTGDAYRIQIADPAVLDAIAVTSRQIVITGVRAGTSLLTFFDKGDRPFPVLVEVVADFSGLEARIKALYPKEDVKVTAYGDQVVLAGSVSDSRYIDEIEAVAALYSESVVNLLRPSGGQQVQLEIKFAEVSRTGLREMGFNAFGTDPAGQAVGGLFSSRSTPGNFLGPAPATGTQGVPGTSSGGGGVPVVPNGSFIGAFHLLFATAAGLPISFTLDLLRSEGLAKTLAEPTLVAMSGETARFLAGGEFPIPIASGNGSVSIDYKQFGIVMQFTPRILGSGVMELALLTEVSDIDFSIGVPVGGSTIPGLSSRRSETTVRLRDGESFAIAGLLSERVKSLIDKVPLLGDIPVLGALFRSTQYRREETELLVVVTPRLVEAVSAVPELPGERLKSNPSDLELFLLGTGLKEVRRSAAKPAKSDATPPDQAPAKAEAARGAAAAPAGAIGFVH
jgi:pilus assembly protein CpaC